MPDIIYTCRPATDAETSHTIAHLKAHTEASTGVEVRYEPFAITAYEGNHLIGSIIGKIYSGWMHMDLVWVDEAHRRRGIGRQLIEHSIAEAEKHTLSGIEVWTQSWQAPEFYLRTGFSEFAVLEDFLPGRKRHILRYTLKENGLPLPQNFEQGSFPIIGRSHAMQEVYKTLARVMSVDLSILVTGESGTGKHLVARALHALGNRKNRPFIMCNMAAIPKALVESELFGHEKGAFPGAVTRKAGAFEQAGDGVLFLDAIEEMPQEAQTHLLRVLQQGEFTPIGSTTPLQTNVRIISATHADLSKPVAEGSLHKDLFYRLNVVQVRMPSLRERKDDIPALVTHFLAKAETKGLPRKEIDRDALPHLMEHSWYGNVRELENLVYRLVTLCADRVISADSVQWELNQMSVMPHAHTNTPVLSDSVRQHVATYFKSHGDALPSSGLYDRLMPLFEKPLIEVTLEATGGNQFKTAQLLGINRNTLRKKIKYLGINI